MELCCVSTWLYLTRRFNVLVLATLFWYDTNQISSWLPKSLVLLKCFGSFDEKFCIKLIVFSEFFINYFKNKRTKSMIYAHYLYIIQCFIHKGQCYFFRMTWIELKLQHKIPWFSQQQSRKYHFYAGFIFEWKFVFSQYLSIIWDAYQIEKRESGKIRMDDEN